MSRYNPTHELWMVKAGILGLSFSCYASCAGCI